MHPLRVMQDYDVINGLVYNNFWFGASAFAGADWAMVDNATRLIRGTAGWGADGHPYNGSGRHSCAPVPSEQGCMGEGLWGYGATPLSAAAPRSRSPAALLQAWPMIRFRAFADCGAIQLGGFSAGVVSVNFWVSLTCNQRYAFLCSCESSPLGAPTPHPA
jgi:hypothetical protein